MKVCLFTGFLLLATCSLFYSFTVGADSTVRAMDSTAAGSFCETAPTPTPTPKPEIDLIPETVQQENADQEKEPDLTDWLDLSLGSPDADCDGILNRDDNCVLKFNPDQADKNGDGVGNACDAGEKTDIRCDIDQDGKLDREDNCILVCNPDQKDKNKNGIGDVCDPDLLKQWERIKPCQKPKSNRVKSPLQTNHSNRKNGCTERP